MSENVAEIFRKEALEHQAKPQHEGHLLQLAPTWTRWSYWLLILVCATAALYAVVGRVGEYASGTAIVKASGRVDLTARSAGTVSSVDVRPGQKVTAGQILARLYFAEEANELRRIQHEFDLQLVKTLRDPSDAVARASLTSLRTQRELAEARLEERTVRATQPGVVSDVRIRPGEHLQPGDVIVSLLGPDTRFRVVAMLPGHYRPLLRRGMPLRLELAGYPYTYQRLTIDVVGDEVVGPAEVQRYLGQGVADTVTSQGPVVLVEAPLPSRVFISDGRRLDYYDGMQGHAEARVRSASLLVTLVPGLRYLTGSGDQ